MSVGSPARPRQAGWAPKILFSALILALLSLRVRWDDVFLHLRAVSAADLGFCLGVNLAVIAIAAWKWKRLLPEVPLLRLFKMNLVSQFYVLVLWGQMSGEFLKAYWVGQSQKDVERVAASVVLDKATAFLALLLAALGGFCLSPRPHSASAKLNLVAAVAVCVALLAVAASEAFEGFFRKVTGPWKGKVRWLDAAVGFFEKFILAWRAYSKPRLLLLLVATSLVYQLLSGLILLRLSQSLGLGIPYAETFWILAVMACALLLPLTVAGIGVREATLAGALSVFGIAPERALAFSFALFLTQVCLSLTGGAVHALDAWKKR